MKYWRTEEVEDRETREGSPTIFNMREVDKGMKRKGMKRKGI